MKSELKFGLYVVLLLIAVLLFDIMTFDDYQYATNWPIGKVIERNYQFIQAAWSFHIVVIAIITTVLVLFQLKKKANLWEFAIKVMWLAFLGIMVIHLGGIFTGVELYLY